MNAEYIARKLDSREGYRLVEYGEVGLPFYEVEVVALLIERSQIDPIEEFLLRGIDLGFRSATQLSSLLGLSEVVVIGALANLVNGECVVEQHEGLVVLTGRGQKAASEGALQRPTEQVLRFKYDGLTRTAVWLGDVPLMTPASLEQRAIPEIRAFPARGPELHELSLQDVWNAVAPGLGQRAERLSLLGIRSIERRTRLYLEALALAFRAHSSEVTQVAFAIDGRLSEGHELAFAKADGIKKTKLFRHLHVRQEHRLEDVLGSELADQVFAAESAIDSLAPAVQHTADSVASSETPPLSGTAEIVSPLVRQIAVYEHPELLRDALDSALERVLIISPWIRSAVVDNEFIGRVRSLLGRGVSVYIGYGLGMSDEDDAPWNRDARQNLERLSREYPAFHMNRFGDTHAKILIKDSDYLVTTSFNWLSFRGDRHRTFREEYGTYVGMPSVINQFFEDLMKRFNDGTQDDPAQS